MVILTAKLKEDADCFLAVPLYLKGIKMSKSGFKAFVMCAVALVVGFFVCSMSGCATGVETRARVFDKQYRSAVGAGIVIEREN